MLFSFLTASVSLSTGPTNTTSIGPSPTPINITNHVPASFKPESFSPQASARKLVTVDGNKAIDQARDTLDDFLAEIKKNSEGLSTTPEQFTTGTADHFESLDLNVMCIHNRQARFTGDEQKVSKENIEVSLRWWFFWRTKGFSIYVAPKGFEWTVTNLGDGGDTNWAFSGDYRRSGSQTVTFY